MGYLDTPSAGGGGGAGGGGAWTLVSKGTADVNLAITGLDGDTDMVYRLILRMNNSSSMQFAAHFNTFDGAATNYQNVGLYTNEAGTSTALSFLGKNSMQFLLTSSQRNLFLDMTIYAASGENRIARSKVAITKIPQDQTISNGDVTHIWTDTTTNITSFHFIDMYGTGSPSGKYWFYKIAS